MRSRERAGPPGGSTAGPPAARSAKSVCALSLSANKDRGAAANDVVSKLKRGHHSDGRRLPENLRGEIRLKAQESDTNKFVPEYPLAWKTACVTDQYEKRENANQSSSSD